MLSASLSPGVKGGREGRVRQKARKWEEDKKRIEKRQNAGKWREQERVRTWGWTVTRKESEEAAEAEDKKMGK